jgi:hypothetical protein
MRLPAHRVTSRHRPDCALKVIMSKVRLIAAWCIGYILITVALYAVFYYYLLSVGGLGKVSKGMMWAFGPAIALGSGHGLELYLLASILVLPLLIVATRAPRAKALFFALAGLAWVSIGVIAS